MNDLHYNMKYSTFNYFRVKINNHLNQEEDETSFRIYGGYENT